MKQINSQQNEKPSAFIYTAGQEKQHSISYHLENNRSLQMIRGMKQQKNILEVCDQNITELRATLKMQPLPQYEKKKPVKAQPSLFDLSAFSADVRSRIEQILQFGHHQPAQQAQEDDDDYEDVEDEQDEDYFIDEEDIDEEDSNAHN